MTMSINNYFRESCHEKEERSGAKTGREIETEDKCLFFMEEMALYVYIHKDSPVARRELLKKCP